jgi:hypothetical protein
MTSDGKSGRVVSASSPAVPTTWASVLAIVDVHTAATTATHDHVPEWL